MSNNLFFARVESEQGIRAALIAAGNAILSAIKAGRGCEIVVRLKRRSGPQNNLLQALCGELETAAEWHGRKLTQDEWRHLFVTGLLGAKVIPGLDGGFLSLIRSSKDLSEENASAAIEMIRAWAAENGIHLTDRQSP